MDKTPEEIKKVLNASKLMDSLDDTFDDLENQEITFDEVSDLVFDQLRELEASKLIPSMQQELLSNINEESFVSDNPSIFQDELSDIKRNSILFPQDVIDVIFTHCAQFQVFRKALKTIIE